MIAIFLFQVSSKKFHAVCPIDKSFRTREYGKYKLCSNQIGTRGKRCLDKHSQTHLPDSATSGFICSLNIVSGTICIHSNILFPAMDLCQTIIVELRFIHSFPSQYQS